MRILSKDLATKSFLSVIFLISVLALSGLGTLDIAVIILLAAVQVSLGSRIWSYFRANQQVSFSETIGMGAAIGFGLSMISSQAFRTVLPRSVSWIVLPLAFAVIVRKVYKEPQIRVESPPQKTNEIYIIITGTIIALSTSWYWLIPTALAALSGTIWALLRENRSNRTKSKVILSRLLGLFSIFLIVRSAIVLNALEEVRNPLWWSYRYAKIQDPDVVFVESMMRSVRLLGGGESIFFAGVRLHYHWFSFAWNDTLNAIFETESFAISGIAAPVLVLFVIMCLLSAIADRLSTNRIGTIATVVAVSAMCAGPVPFLRALHPYSYSFAFSLIYIFAIVLILLSQETTKIVSNLGLTFLFSTMLIGSKVTAAPTMILGILSINIFCHFTKNKQRNQIFAISLAAAAATISVWFFVYFAPEAEKSNSFKLGVGEIFKQKAYLSSGLTTLVFAVGFISLLLVSSYSLIGLAWIRELTTSGSRLALVFAVTGGAVSLVMALLISDDLESSGYLIQTSFALLIPFSVIALSNSSRNLIVHTRKLLLGFVVIGILLARVSWSLVDKVSGNANAVVYKTSIIILLPIIVSFLVLIASALFGFTKFRTVLVLVSALLVSAGTVGSYAAFATEFYRDGVNYRELHVDDADTITGSTAYREMLIWLRNNSRSDDLVATNRYCSDSYETPPGCLSLWSLTSAISIRQVLGEEMPGTRVIGYVAEREKRRVLVESFVNLPTEQSRSALLDYGVHWVVADFAVTQTRDWGNFANLRFKNSAGAILELTSANS